MTVDLEAQEALARLIDPFSQGAASNEAGEAADRIIAAGWKHVPPGDVVVQTEGGEWEAMFHRAAQAWFQFEKDEGRKDFPEQLQAALRAAITPKQETSDGE